MKLAVQADSAPQLKMSCLGGGASDETLKEQTRRNKAIDQQLKKDKDVYKSTHRLLLLGE